MNKLSILPFALLLSCTGPSEASAQDLSAYRWQNRVLLVLSGEENEQRATAQLAELAAAKEGLEERKLLVFQVLPNQYRQAVLRNGQWQPTTDIFQAYAQDGEFTVVLLGLDGGVKIRQPNVLAVNELFSTIDGMPMRRAELRRQRPTKNE
ncbi:MAG: DUF4174 domain-containing protein [Bacteroidota bacterium]